MLFKPNPEKFKRKSFCRTNTAQVYVYEAINFELGVKSPVEKEGKMKKSYAFSA